MAKPDKRNGYYNLEAVNPFDGKPWTLFISRDRLGWIAKRGEPAVSETAYILKGILLRPRAIFKGLRRDEDEDTEKGDNGWLAYCGLPEIAFDGKGQRRKPFVNQVYLAFVNEDRVVYNWRWEKCSSENPIMPMGFKDRFKRQLL